MNWIWSVGSTMVGSLQSLFELLRVLTPYKLSYFLFLSFSCRKFDLLLWVFDVWSLYILEAFNVSLFAYNWIELPKSWSSTTYRHLFLYFNRLLISSSKLKVLPLLLFSSEPLVILPLFRSNEEASPKKYWFLVFWLL